MVGKVCAAPTSGGSSRGAVKYVLGYALGDKQEAVQAREDFAAIIDASMDRHDLGVGTVWEPGISDRTRPAAIYCHGATSLATFDQECQMLAQANPRVREPVLHVVFSLGDGVDRTNAEMIEGINRTLSKLGFDDHAYLIALHRDTDNLHGHVVISAVNSKTLNAYNRHKFHTRIDEAMRHTEKELGWEHDRGLVIVDDLTGEVRQSTKKERALWGNERRAEKEQDRLARLELKKEYLDAGFERKADATIGPRLQTTLDALRDAGEQPDWAELHLTAARYGSRLEIGDVAEGESGSPPPPAISLVDTKTGEKVLLSEVLRDDLRDLGDFQSVEHAEQAFIERVKADPDYIARRIGNETSTFDRDDVLRFLDARVSDVGEVEELTDLVLWDSKAVIVSADTQTPLYATERIHAIETGLRDHARELGRQIDGSFDGATLDVAIAKVERDLGPGARLSDEQRAIVSHLDRGLVVAEGDPGSGKTVAMRVAKQYADLTGKEIVGLTISQAAARRLQDESGIDCYNTSKGLMLEELGDRKIPHQGILVLDEAGMDDSKTAERLLSIARERECQVLVIGDTKQLQPILAGQSLRIIREEARSIGTYETLVQIQRQKNEWHGQSVTDLADGLRGIQTTGHVDGEKVRSAIERLAEHDVFEKVGSYQESIAKAARQYVQDRVVAEKMGIEHDAVYLASSKETQRYANEAVRRELGLEGAGKEYVTRYGTREFAEGDRIVFKENNKKLGLVNGDQGTVVGHGRFGNIEVLHDDGRTITVNTVTYDAVDHGYFQTYHAAQGASVRRCTMLLDQSASAELFFVGASRSKENLKVIYAESSFIDTNEIAEHVASRSSLKTTSLTFGELIGPGISELDKKIIHDIEAAENHPLRAKYEALEAAKAEKRTAALEALHATIAEKKQAVAMRPDLSTQEKIDATKDLKGEQRRGAQDILDAYKPVQFGRFVRDEVLAARTERERQNAREQERERRTQEQQRIAERERAAREAAKVREALRNREQSHDHGLER